MRLSYLSYAAVALLFAVSPCARPTHASEDASQRSHAIAVTEVHSTGPGAAYVVVKNSGDLPLRDVRVTWTTSPAVKATFDPRAIPLLRAGEVRRFDVNGTDRTRALVTVGDKAGWARACRSLERDSAPITALGLRLRAEAPRQVEVARPFSMRFAVESLAAGGVESVRPATQLVLSVLLPSGVRTVDGKTHVRLDLPRGSAASASTHRFAPVALVADRPGPFRVRAVVRDAAGRASAGVLRDMDALPEGSLDRQGDGRASEADDADVLEDAPFVGVPRAKPKPAATPRDAVRDALAWLEAHQSPDGRWAASGFGARCRGKPIKSPARRPDGRGNAAFDVGVTGLAAIAMLVGSDTGKRGGAALPAAARALSYLRRVQDGEGCYGPRSHDKYIYNHATASVAMVLAFAITGDVAYRKSAQRALDFIELARNPYFAWRYGIKPGDNDTSVSAWMATALVQARSSNGAARVRGQAAPYKIDDSWEDGVQAWLTKVTDPDYGIVGYATRGSGPSRPVGREARFPSSKSAAMTAAALFIRLHTLKAPNASELVRLGVSRCSKLLPVWDERGGSIDMIYWYFGTLAMRLVGGQAWKAWRGAMQKCAVGSQRRDTDACGYKGSWDPSGPWGKAGGRVFATALMALSLEVSVRN